MLENVITQYINNEVDRIVNEKVNEKLKELFATMRKEQKSALRWAKAKEVALMFGVSRSTVYADMRNMEKDPKFSKYVMQSSATKTVNIEGYERYRQYLSDSYLR